MTQPTAFSELFAVGNEVFPLANGNAYLVNELDQQVFLLSGSSAQRVEGVSGIGTIETPMIFALPDGRAYLTASDGDHLRLYLLDGATASKVTERLISHSQTLPPTTEAFLWSQVETAHMRLRRVEANDADDDPRPEEFQ